MWQRKNRKRKGFTLVELLVVIIILGLLAGLAAPKLINQLRGAKIDLVPPELQTIETVIDMYLLNCGEYPNTLVDLIECPAGLENVWPGAYIEEKTLYDPWDNMYQYYPSGADYVLFSLGEDGVESDDDIYN